MPDDRIPNKDHVSRYCGYTKCHEGLPKGDAFMMRPGEPALSVNWLESTGKQDRLEQIETVRNYFGAKNRKLATQALFAVLHLENTFEYVKRESPDNRELYSCHEPELPEDPSHAAIHGYSEMDQLIADLISLTVIETHPAIIS